MGTRRRLQCCGILFAAAISRLSAQGTGALVAGVVVDEATGAPVRKAVVELFQLGEGRASAQDVSDAQGRFGFSNLPPGKYRLRGTKEGYAPKMLGANHSGHPGVILTLAAGDARWNLRLAIPPFGAITGRVTDADGDPLPYAQLEILQQGWQRGKAQWQNRGAATTDNRGEYRLESVPAGKYLVMASRTDGGTMPGDRSSFAMEIYPGTDRVSKAAPVQVTPGREVNGIDFSLVPRPTVAVKGHVNAPPELPENMPVNLLLFPRDDFGRGHPWEGAAFGKDRTIQMQETAPGPYRLVASASNDGAAWRSVTDVEVTDGGEELSVPLYPGVALSGSVTVEGPGAEQNKSFNVTLVPGDGLPPGDALPQTKTGTDGSFTLSNVVMGIWDINVTPIPKGGYLKSMTLGDQDVLTEDMTITPATSAPLKIVVSTRGAKVSGDIESEGAAAGKQAIAFLAPEGKFSRVLSFYRRVLADEKGHFEMQGIDPGTYRIYAFEELGVDGWQDPEFLKRFAGRGEAVTLAEGQTAEVKPKLIRVGEGGGAGQ